MTGAILGGRLMSFSATTRQIRDRSKTVTRRIGWLHARPGQVLCAVEKAQGLKRGEKVKRLCCIRIDDVRREPLNAITADDVIKEGFPDMTPAEFVALFMSINKCPAGQIVTRIEFEYL